MVVAQPSHILSPPAILLEVKQHLKKKFLYYFFQASFSSLASFLNPAQLPPRAPTQSPLLIGLILNFDRFQVRPQAPDHLVTAILTFLDSVQLPQYGLASKTMAALISVIGVRISPSLTKSYTRQTYGKFSTQLMFVLVRVLSVVLP